MENNTIKQARELGKAIQADERYVAYYKAKEINDADEGLQEAIGSFNLIRQNLSMEAAKQDNRDQSKIESLNKEAQESYAKIMENDNMKAFTEAKNTMDALIREVSEIISMSCDGEDPATCQVAPAGGCGGGCSSCAGCG